MMALNTIAASVNADGSIYQNPGSGIENVDQVGTGQYIVQFTRPFTSPPVVTVSQNYPGWNSQISKHGSSLDNAVVVFVNNTSAGVIVGDAGGNLQNRNFTLIAFGDQH